VWELPRGGPHLYEFIDKQQSVLTGALIHMYSSSIRDLQPNTAYILKMTIFYDTSESMSSEWSNTFRTQEITVPGTLPPRDLSPPIIPIIEKKPKKNSKKTKKNKKEIVDPIISPLEVFIKGLTAHEGETPNNIVLNFTAPFDDGGADILGAFGYIFIYAKIF
jgi:hypothetical protein